MPIMTSYEFSDIVLAPFPFTDQTSSKKRPAVVVSSATYNQDRPDLIIMAITSQIRPSAMFGEVIIIDWRAAGLLKPSAIKPVLASIEKSMILRKLGRLEEADRQELREALQKILGL
jgi:mRNA interferase MazF